MTLARTGKRAPQEFATSKHDKNKACAHVCTTWATSGNHFGTKTAGYGAPPLAILSPADPHWNIGAGAILEKKWARDAGETNGPFEHI